MNYFAERKQREESMKKNEATELLRLHSLKIQKPMTKIMTKLGENYMTVSDMIRILKVTRRQLFHWDRKMVKLTGESRTPRSWRKFSIIDLFAFAVIREIRKFGLPLSKCKGIFAILNAFVYHFLFMYHFTEGDGIFLFIDFETPYMIAVFEGQLQKLDSMVHNMKRPKIIYPLHHLFRAILVNVKKKDFYIKITDSKITFVVDGHPTAFDLTAEEREIICEEYVLGMRDIYDWELQLSDK